MPLRRSSSNRIRGLFPTVDAARPAPADHGLHALTGLVILSGLLGSLLLLLTHP